MKFSKDAKFSRKLILPVINYGEALEEKKSMERIDGPTAAKVASGTNQILKSGVCSIGSKRQYFIE